MHRLSYAQRAAKFWPSDSTTSTPRHLGAAFLRLMEEKKSNLCVAADVCTSKDLLDLVQKIGPEICLLKVQHITRFINHTFARHTVISLTIGRMK